jgi:hypothetical protein
MFSYELQGKTLADLKALSERLTIAIGHLMYIAEHGDARGLQAKKALELIETVDP